MSNQTYISKLNLTLDLLASAYDEMLHVDGMDSYCERLSMLSAEITAELLYELESVE
jgi:hypothetical protein